MSLRLELALSTRFFVFERKPASKIMIADKRPVPTLASPEYHEADCSLGKHVFGQDTPVLLKSYLHRAILAKVDVRDFVLDIISSGAASPTSASALKRCTLYNIDSPPPEISELACNRLLTIPINSNADDPDHHMAQ